MRGAAEAAATTVKGKLTVILCHGDDCIDGKLSCALLLGASKLKGDMLVVCPHSHGQHVWEEVVEATNSFDLKNYVVTFPVPSTV